MSAPRLPCGAAYDDLLSQAADGTPPSDHQRGCRHCRAALADLQDLWSPVHELAAEQVHAPADLLSTVMARVQQLSRSPWHAVIPTDRGQTQIAARVVAAIARLAAQELAPVTLALGAGRSTRPVTTPDIAGAPATEVGVAGTHVVVDIQIVVELGQHLPTVADQLRAHLAQRISEQLGLTAAEVNILIVDVQPSGGRPQATRRISRSANPKR